LRRLGVLGALALVVALLAVAQLVLPGVAAQRLRDRLSRSGRVIDVAVHAFPAIELLWHRADRVAIRMATYRATPSSLADTLAQARDVGTLHASARATIPVFSDPRLRVTAVSATPLPGGFIVRGTAVLR
jgi:hypothetical protein